MQWAFASLEDLGGIIGGWPWSPSPCFVFPHFHIFPFHLIPIMSDCFLGDLTLLKKERYSLQIGSSSKGGTSCNVLF